MNQPIPFLDLRAQFDSIKDEVLPALMDVVESQRFIMGAAVGELEDAIARLCGTRHAIACASGTDALLLPLWARTNYRQRLSRVASCRPVRIECGGL